MALAFVMYTPVLILYAPPHRCVLPENETTWFRPTSLEEQSCYLEQRSTPVRRYNFSVHSDNLIEIIPSQPLFHGQHQDKVFCPFGWEYNTTGLFETAVMDVNE